MTLDALQFDWSYDTIYILQVAELLPLWPAEIWVRDTPVLRESFLGRENVSRTQYWCSRGASCWDAGKVVLLLYMTPETGKSTKLLTTQKRTKFLATPVPLQSLQLNPEAFPLY